MNARRAIALLLVALLLAGAWLAWSNRPTTTADPAPSIAAEPEPAPSAAMESTAPQRELAPAREAPAPPATGVGRAAVATPRATVRGRVVDPQGRGLADAKVQHRVLAPPASGVERAFTDAMRARLPFPDAGSTVTDGEGRFELHLGEVGKHELAATHAAHPQLLAEVNVVQLGDRIDDVLLAMPPSATIVGRAVDVPADTEVSVVAAIDARAPLPLGLGAGLDILDDHDVARSVKLAADGTFALPGLAIDAKYRVALRLGTNPLQPLCSESAKVRAPADGVVLRFVAPLVVTAMPIDAQTRAPLRQVDVRATFVSERQIAGGTSRSESTTTYAKQATRDGRVQVAVRPQKNATELRLTIYADGYGAREIAPLALSGQQQIDLGEVALDAPPRLRVQVLRAGTREPIAEATVILSVPTALAMARRRGTPTSATRQRRTHNEIARGTTDAQGIVELVVGEGQSGTVRIEKAGFAARDSEVPQLPTQGVGEHTVELGAGARIDVRVVDAQGLAVAAARVQAQRQDAPGPDLWVCDDAGRAHVANLTAGEYRFTLEGARDASAQTATVADGETKEVTLTLPARGSVAGVVTIGGQPAAGVTVSLFAEVDAVSDSAARALLGSQLSSLLGESAAPPATTDAAGTYRIPAAPLGTYRLRLRRDREVLPAAPPVVVAAGVTRCDVDLAAVAIRGRVVDGAGQPVAGAQVRLATVAGASGEAAAGLFGLPADEAKGLEVGADGRFEIRAMAGGGELQIEAWAPEHCRARSAALDLRGAGIDVSLVLERGGRLRARMPASSVAATIERVGQPPSVHTVLVREGVADFGLLPPGRWRVRAEPAVEVEIVAGQTAEIVVGT